MASRCFPRLHTTCSRHEREIFPHKRPKTGSASSLWALPSLPVSGNSTKRDGLIAAHLRPLITSIELLGIEHLRDRKQKRRHRPPRIDAPLLRDKIVQSVLFERAVNPKKRMKQIIYDVGNYHRVSRRLPERRKQIVAILRMICDAMSFWKSSGFGWTIWGNNRAHG
jgi:hypothetical protein